ncbi:MAG TPA: hypothetical protein VF169_14475 [Albitalea sp.]
MTIPTKTALGNEELRSRKQRLGQRHRTILFLVDGRRTLAEVLSLAQQAGANTSHFEELVRLGLVEVPQPPPPPPEPEPEAEAAPAVTSVELDLPTLADALELPPAIVPDPAPPPVLVAPPVAPRLTEVVLPPSTPKVLPPVAVTPVAAAVAASAGPAREKPAVVLPVLSESAAVVPRQIARSEPEPGEAQLLQRVRERLLDALRLGAPLLGGRTAMRVRNAQTAQELIDLTWEIEGHLLRGRHARRDLSGVQEARELLGMGNTLVADEDSRPPYLDE